MKKKIGTKSKCINCGREIIIIRKDHKFCSQKCNKSYFCKKVKKEKKEYISKLRKISKCKICGYNKHPEVLVFHHRKSSKDNKWINILRGGSYSLKLLKKEIEKCDILCPNCHQWLHYKIDHSLIRQRRRGGEDSDTSFESSSPPGQNKKLKGGQDGKDKRNC